MKVNKELRVDATCTHVHKEKKGGCSKPEAPGLASGGCSFEGAYFALAPCSDALHLVHGPMTCLGSSWETRHTETSCAGRDFTQMGFTTDMSDMDVVYSGEKKLANAIDYALEHHHPAAVFVYETCVPALIGDDMDAVCSAAEVKWGLPVVPIHAPGFVGSKNFGGRLGLEAVVNHLTGTREPECSTPYDINIIGDYNITGEMWQYSPLLEEIGIRILSTFSGDGRVDKMRKAHRAKLNIVVCAKSVEAVCKLMQKRWGIPYISVSFYGMRDVSESIRSICQALGGDAELVARAEAVIAREEARVEHELAPFRALLKGRKAVLNTGGNKAWSIAAGLQDLGLEVVATSVRKSNEEDKEKARRYLGANAVLMVKPEIEQMDVIVRTGADILLAGGRSLFAAVKKRIAFIDVNQEKCENYCGYNGLINLARDVVNSLSNPVFRLVDQPAPWECHERDVIVAPDVAPMLTGPPIVRKTLPNRKPLQVNPLKMSQPMGATLAFMGIKGCLPLMHGAIGCASLTKVSMTRHFCEPIALRNTAVTEISTALDGGDKGVAEAVRNSLARVTPDVIGLFSTGLTDAKGDDLKGIASKIDYPIVWADTPDYLGGFESGWAKVVTAFITQVVVPCHHVDSRKVLVLPHVSLQPLELEGLKDVLSALELDVFALPDLSTSLDGHLGQDQAALCQGGIQMSEIRGLASAATVITIGESMRAVGECFTNLHPLTRHLHVPGIMGLQASDEFIGQMVELTSIEPNERIKLWRDRLRDAMIDAHFSIGKTRFILAGEPDRIADMARALVEVGGTIRAVVSSTPSKVLDGVRAEQVMVGDLEDVEAMLDECDVLICNMHGHRLAQAHGKIHVARGYPIYEQIGVQMKVDTLYQGGTQFLIDIANAIIEERLRKHH